MELYHAHRHIEIGGDFLAGKALMHTLQHFLLTWEFGCSPSNQDRTTRST